jgi:hypothetical protein
MKVLFSPVEFRSIASVGVIASKEDITPIICSVNFKYEGGEFSAVATDRYRIARSKFTLSTVQHDELPDFDITIPASMLTKFWNSIKVEALKGVAPIEFDITYGDVEQYWSFTYNGVVSSGAEVKGSFPPVEKLIQVDLEQYTGTPKVGLKPSFLADLGKLFAASDYTKVDKDLPWTFYFGNSDSGKPMPVYVTRNPERTDGASVIEYLVQPNYILR